MIDDVIRNITNIEEAFEYNDILIEILKELNITFHKIQVLDLNERIMNIINAVNNII